MNPCPPPDDPSRAAYEPTPETAAALYARAEALDAEAREVRKRASQLRYAELRARQVGDRLVYAATARCPCGLGLAYDPAARDPAAVFSGPAGGFWDCSGILLGTADTAVVHTARLPFAFYEVKAEGQPSAGGATTRPRAR